MKRKYLRFINEKCVFPDGTLNFREFYLTFIRNQTFPIEGEFKENIRIRRAQEMKKKRRKRKKLKKMIIYENIDINNSLNPFFDIRKPESSHKFIKNIEDMDYPSQEYKLKDDDVYYPFWFDEDERFFHGKSITKIKSELIDQNFKNNYMNMEIPFLIFRSERGLRSVTIDDIPKMKKRILNTIKNTKRISMPNYKPIDPSSKVRKHRNKQISDQEKFMLKVMKCCNLGHENDPDEGTQRIIFQRRKKRFKYNVDFERIKRYFG